MELKRYQRKVLDNLRAYLRLYAVCGDAAAAYNRYLSIDGLAAGGPLPSYTDDLHGIPKVCVKVPTGGGKTFIAANALGVVCDELPERPADVVVWLVPRKEILRQTLAQLQDVANPLRMAIDRDFSHKVEVLDKEDGLRGRGFTVDALEDQLTLFILSYDSFKNKDGRRAYAENSAMSGITGYQRDTGQAFDVEGADDTALISALAGTNPVVVVDESHHAKSSLSLDMLRNLNPRFVLELTATPRRGSNVISRVSARELKDEQMVKLPVIVYRRHGKREVVQDAVLLQRQLEAIAEAERAKGGDYIRPIVLLQAQPRGADGAETYQKLKRKLIDAGIPEGQVAVRTGDVDELGGADLMNPACEIRFIITVEALAEGWDCPFAYILATVANRSSKVSVEQIVGRILRQPYAHRSPARSLNISYVLTSSEDFTETVEQVIEGLNGAGFSKRDVVQSEAQSVPVAAPVQPGIEGLGGDTGDGVLGDDFELVFPETPIGWASSGATGAGGSGEASESIARIIRDAEESERSFEEEIKNVAPVIGGTGLGDGVNRFEMSAAVRDEAVQILLPQFRTNRSAGLFSDGVTQPFERHMLLDGFDLTACGTGGVVLDEAGADDARQVDIDPETGEFKVRDLSRAQADDMRALFRGYSDEGKRRSIRDGIMDRLSPRFRDTYGERGLRGFIERVARQMTPEQVDAYVENSARYAQAVSNAVRIQSERYCKEEFARRLGMGDISLEPMYRLPAVLIVREPKTMYDRTLYEAESGDMNAFEGKMAYALSNSPRIRWWHRVDERRRDTEFCINGFINHYPDFLAMTEGGRVLAIETKGEQLKNDDSRDKLELGGKWALAAGSGFGYFMVFERDALAGDNSYTFDEFKNMVLNG